MGEHSTGHDTYHGLFILCVYMQCEYVRMRVNRACICALDYILTDSLQICWEHMSHHKWDGQCTFHDHAQCARVHVRAPTWLTR
jgi:hypothetical protein